MIDATTYSSIIAGRFAGACLFGIMSLALSGTAWAGPVQCKPESVSFSRLDDSATIHLYVDGALIPSGSLLGARATIEGRNYSHQFFIERSKEGPAVLTIRPNPAQVQVGEFTLRIDTLEGPAVVALKTPLDTLPGTLENRAKALEISVEQLKAELNLLQKGQRERVDVQLPDSYEEGYLFELALGENPEHDYRWTVNGEVVASGKGEGTLRHVFTQPGPNSIQFEERKGGALVAAWSGTLAVKPAPVVPWEVPANTAVSLPGPPGFANYTWRVDGAVTSREPILHHTFGQKENYKVECRAEVPDKGAAAEYRRMTWDVAAK